MSVNFGTSGLRAPAEGFTTEVCRAYVSAFLDVTCKGAASRTVYVGADLRDSSPRIAAACVSAIAAEGWTAVYAGNVPTPAVAAYALERGCPAVMITGSHIPETYNGIKFYRPDGEFLKDDEAPVREKALALLNAGVETPVVALPAVDPAIATAYVQRYAKAFAGAPLKGIKIGVDLHSAVGRDLTVEILTALGAEVHPFRRADRFIAVDTEALDPADIARDRQIIAELKLDAVVSTDGDGDRPLVIDDAGNQVNGDILGALTARFLGIATVVTPLSSTSAIELSGWFKVVDRTKIGSPYVVAGMAAATLAPIAGFEANGGFLLQSDLALAAGALTRLPTRDAILPMIGVLLMSARDRKPLSALVAELPPRVMKADRLKEIAPEIGGALLKKLATDDAARVALDARLAAPADVNLTDGVRLSYADGAIVHFRQSGNAPELRCYVETESAPRTEALLKDMVARLEATLR
ncbi:phosphomannomutase [Oryzibacter oryziterrae]|uniref:phosphomannomutase n=1 Tax=Oryzibacter oryziterrae TaxID=2766474 RepID=UPI001F3E6C67|nr:phosphomannomutase [Oryzibacter oryziterrae]